MTNTAHEATMEVAKETPEEKEVHLSKAQKRIQEVQEKTQQRATKVLQGLCQRFLDYLIDVDNPSDDELNGQARVLSAQWKMYCINNNLNKVAFDMVSKFCEEKIKEFNDLKQGKEIEEGAPVSEPVQEPTEKV